MNCRIEDDFSSRCACVAHSVHGSEGGAFISVCVCVCEDAVLRCATLLHHAMQVAHSCAPICYAIYAMLFAMPYALLYSMPLLVAAVAPHSCICRRSYGRRL